ncbi:MAG: type II toxin-antitoxin system VapC family toxin [Thermoleophilia bacterium]
MTLVVDASVVIDALEGGRESQALILDEDVHVPHLVDVEVLSGLRRAVLRGRLARAAAADMLSRWARLGVARHEMGPLLPRAWSLRDNLTAYDAMYVALAERLGCALATSDGAMASAPGIRCPVVRVPPAR